MVKRYNEWKQRKNEKKAGRSHSHSFSSPPQPCFGLKGRVGGVGEFEGKESSLGKARG